MENLHHQQPLAKKTRRNINTFMLSATVVGSTSSASMPGDMVINIEQTPPTLCQSKLQQTFSGQNAQSKLLQRKSPLELSNSTSRKRRCMICFISERKNVHFH
jgi:hypothetical protein